MTDELKQYYETIRGNEEMRLQHNSIQYTEFLTLEKYFDKLLKPGSKILDPCAGTGVYAFHLADRGHQVIAGDLLAIHVDIMREKQEKRKQQAGAHILKEIYQGDILDLSGYAAESFDAVLCMGALYHMQDKNDRDKAIQSCLRVLKPGGVLVATYINRYAAILGSCNGELLNIADMLKFLDNGSEGAFYAHTPAQLEAELAAFPLELLFHIGVDGIGYLLHGDQPILSYEGLQRWRKLHFATCEVRELLGYSYHGAYFGRKLST